MIDGYIDISFRHKKVRPVFLLEGYRPVMGFGSKLHAFQHDERIPVAVVEYG